MLAFARFNARFWRDSLNDCLIAWLLDWSFCLVDPRGWMTDLGRCFVCLLPLFTGIHTVFILPGIFFLVWNIDTLALRWCQAPQLQNRLLNTLILVPGINKSMISPTLIPSYLSPKTCVWWKWCNFKRACHWFAPIVSLFNLIHKIEGDTHDKPRIDFYFVVGYLVRIMV